MPTNSTSPESPPAPTPHMSPGAFRQHGHALIEWLARYMEEVERYPVLARVKPGWVRSQLPAHAPAGGESFDSMLADVERIILPGITHWQSPNFFAYFPANASGPSILGELLAAGLGVNGMLWATSPACTELETHVLDWLVEMLGLPRAFRSDSDGGGVIQDTASSASLCALLAARERASALATNARGVQGRFTVYASTHAHSSIEKAMMIAGLGREQLRAIPAPAANGYAMDVGALAQAIEADVQSGCTPCFIAATVGTTSSNAIDPVRDIALAARAASSGRPIWLHVDAAMSGTAALCPEFRWIHDGLELADSYCFNPHKWMFTNFDCDCMYVARRAELIQALSVLPEYLKNQASQSGSVIDYRDWQVPLGRRFRALKLWFVIRHYGVDGLQHHIRQHVRLAQMLASWIENDRRFEMAAPAPLNLVCFRLRQATDADNQRLLETLNGSGKLHLSHTRLDGRYTLRMCIGQTHTQEQHVRNAWQTIQHAADEILAASSK